MGLMDQYYTNDTVDLSNSGYMASGAENPAQTGEDVPQQLTQEQIAALSENPEQVARYQNDGTIPAQYDDLAKFIVNQSGGRAPAETLADSLSQMIKKNGGEIFSNLMAGSATGVLNFIASRRKSREDSKLIDKKYMYEKQATDAQVARASAMPTLTSVAKPSVSGKQLVGSQRQSGGLTGAVKQRSE